jgi:hypothetical protein
MFDIFYSGEKPNYFPHEQEAESIQQAQKLSRTRYFWWITYLADLDTWDFLWEPTPWQSHQRHAWPSQHQKDAGVYLVPRDWNGTDTNYHTVPTINRLEDRYSWDRTDYEFDYSWHPDYSEPPMNYQFGTQWQRTGGPCYRVAAATDVKFIDNPRVYKTSRDPNWKIPSGEFSDFDWTWHPDATDPAYIYQFGTQHQRTGGPQYVVPGATDIKFVDQIKIKTARVATAVIEIDHLDGNAGLIPEATERARYFDNYRDTLIRIAKKYNGQHEFVWICSSVCDYTGFDFSWHPEQWQATMLHVFASNDQKFGDTFFMHVPTFAYRAERAKLLDWYDVNFVEDIAVPRRGLPVIEHTFDSQADAVKSLDFSGPLAVFTTNGMPITMPTVSLWRQETKTIVPLSVGASAVIIPKAAVGSVKKQLYDYPYIDKTQSRRHGDQPLDIVFIENGEPNADDNRMMLQNRILGLEPNKLHRVSNVNGRAAAYHAAARASATPWFFAVFAKLAIDFTFDWAWQPDRMQEPKHYIFHARNPVNGLEYGHQAMIAYNRDLVLANPGVGLDFTLDSPHEVVPILSGTALYNVSAWQCWRTAFREVLKLKAALPDVEAQYRIDRWCLTNFGEIDRWSQLGALDAIEYYDEVNGDFAALKKSYEWDWLASYALIKRNLTPAQ